MEEKIGIVVPTRKRNVYIKRLVDSLVSSNNSDRLEINIFVDEDQESYDFVVKLIDEIFSNGFKGNFNLGISEEQIYANMAYNAAFDLCTTNLFCWVSDIVEFIDRDWINKAVTRFYECFPDTVGVMAFQQGGAGFGMSSKKFVSYNDGEWFHKGYLIHYADPELTHRAILMRKFAWLWPKITDCDKGDREANHCMNPKIRYDMTVRDGFLYDDRRDHLFFLPDEKIKNHDHDFLNFKECYN
jgi:hypothetical protein